MWRKKHNSIEKLIYPVIRIVILTPILTLLTLNLPFSP